MTSFKRFGPGLVSAFTALSLTAQPVLAQTIRTEMPENILPPSIEPTPQLQPRPEPRQAPSAVATQAPAAGTVPAVSQPVVQPLFLAEPVMSWSLVDAQALLSTIEQIGTEGLLPADYQPDALRAAIAAGEGDALDTQASRVFAWLIEDLRDGRTPMSARVQWFAVDPDQDTMPTAQIMAQALSDHDVPGVVDKLAPTVPDYAALKDALAETPVDDEARRALIRVNMDRWRWLARDLGDVYLLTNVPEYQLRLTVKNKIIRTYRTVVGKPGRTATPQLAEKVTGVVFNPTWTVPQSIVKGEGLGAKVLANPNWARARGYKATRGADGTIYVVQQPGPGNSLGLMKIDMPNPHAIYLHDTPSKQYFDHSVRAYSHGCIRTERAVELGMTMAILGAQMPAEEAADISRSGKYTKVEMTRSFPVYLTYFTLARSIDGQLEQFDDLYGRDAPVLESFTQPRELKTTQRASDEEIIRLDNPL
ncbi:L,D-transpeptidase family protein [Novosphingobium mangrovi (ex Huang et al. 2023)]|uniref:L,D-transpeptidase family protein n=1 Tax=Novosphingobium mangrovi (ex Huang et al. 2023) TaxID=2976432 RepID=A0ABT2I387_9SPHN|nr:L,D-transpeptidase family protein [Novosphingobium mangrovi (ex Huang et al. 2023)]MCT2399275.1 L,D-transpeptidase family protein [Novosphingobium mangrovi (ex Huang et al. 2023)]